MRVRTPRDVASLGTIMGVWAHPDDETFLSAGLMAAASANKQRVICVTATHGEAGVQNEQKWPRQTLGQTRVEELRQALQILGVAEHYWLNYADGLCKDAPQTEAVQALTDIIAHCRPETILTFGGDGLTGHDDHRTVSVWVGRAVKACGLPIRILHSVETPYHYHRYMLPVHRTLNFYFNIDQPPLKRVSDCAIYLRLPKALLDLKLQALVAHSSQTNSLFAAFPAEALYGAFATEAFVLV